MGSAKSPFLADTAVNNFLLKNCNFEKYPYIGLAGYVDDILLISELDKAQTEQLVKGLNSKNDLQFTFEYEKEHKIPFLDVLIWINEKSDEIGTSWYRKETASTRLLDFNSDHTDEPVQENQSCTNSPVRMQFNSKQVNDGDIPTKADSGTILEQLVHMIHKSLMTHHNEQHTSTEIVTQQQRTDEVTVVRSEKEAKNFNIEEYNVDKHNKVSLKPLMNVTDSSMTMVDQQYHVTTLAPVDEERITVVRKK
ncbi:unnamed protein product [Didymodactylos carnosus]|uniref:Reverse transcriptase domain-containing protein n=1 Tax=Didymodactylos carnosus TaxID=1234261 RepID=A0A815WGL7_9BILA|nr:unnamed protein product [Didymodactylos carnosus]CAF4404285.1 unnamed protein product [Didymodactylos carnosus]